VAKRAPEPVACPSCGIPLAEAFIRQLAAPQVDQVTRELRAQITEQAREEARAACAGDLTALRAKVREREEDQREASEAAEELRAELARKDQELKQTRAEEKKAREERRRLQEEKDGWELEKARMRDQITGEVRTAEERRASQQAQIQLDRAARDHQTELREKDNYIQGLKKELEAAHRKASAGPRPQEKGLARQELLGEELQARWPGDDVRLVGRGERGGDLVHVVRDGGRDCGIILWECKDQQRWRKDWLAKLSRDVERHRAAFGVIVTTALPPEVSGSARLGDVVVCDFSLATHLAEGFRQMLITSSQYESANLARQDAAGKVYDYITTGGFCPRLEKVVEYVREETRILDMERNYHQRRWTEREQALREMITGVFAMASELAAAGAELPPPLRAELPAPPDRVLLPAT
jgi:hypothetical protein